MKIINIKNFKPSFSNMVDGLKRMAHVNETERVTKTDLSFKELTFSEFMEISNDIRYGRTKQNFIICNDVNGGKINGK